MQLKKRVAQKSMGIKKKLTIQCAISKWWGFFLKFEPKQLSFTAAVVEPFML